MIKFCDDWSYVLKVISFVVTTVYERIGGKVLELREILLHLEFCLFYHEPLCVVKQKAIKLSYKVL